jgi:transcriptional regulator with XRE-family HTH domain
MDLKGARIKKNLTQAGLSDLSGVSDVTISNLENGKTMAQSGTREAIEKALGMPVDWVSTRMQRPIKFVDSEEEAILRSIRDFIYSGPVRDRLQRIGYCRQILDYFEREAKE